MFVNTPIGPHERDVTVGLSNERVVEIKDGLTEGDDVILNPKAILGDKVKTRQVIDKDTGLGEGRGKGKGKNRPNLDKGDLMPPGMNGGGAPPGGGGAPAVKDHK